MATPLSNKERGLPSEDRVVSERVAASDRGTGVRGIPAAQPYENTDRYVTYRFEDTVRQAPNSAYRKIYPYWAPVLVQKGNAAPERLVLGGGIVAFRVEPDWQGPPEARLTPPPLIAARLPPPPHPPQDHGPEPAKPPPGPIECPPGYMPTKSGRSCIETPETEAQKDKEWKRQEFIRAVRDYTDATLGDGFKNGAKVAKAASLIPGPAGRVFKIVENVLEGVHDAYEGAAVGYKIQNTD